MSTVLMEQITNRKSRPLTNKRSILTSDAKVRESMDNQLIIKLPKERREIYNLNS